MKIVLTFDTGYAPHAATTMESIIQYCPDMLELVVIYYNLSKETQDIFLNHFGEKVKSLEFYEVDYKMLAPFEKIKNVPHISGLNVFLRLLVCDILPPADTHIVYLDCDIIVQDNILKILNEADLSKPVCAVSEYNPMYKWRDLHNLETIETPICPWIEEAYWFRTLQNLAMKPTASYFNAGVMVINLEYWRKYRIAEKAINFLLENPDKCYAADQDALNHAIDGDYFLLAPKWNTAAIHSAALSGYTAEQLHIANKQPSIIHAVCAIKPWHYMSIPLYKKLYRKYRLNTPYNQIVYPDKTLHNIIYKFLREMMKFLTPNKIKNFIRTVQKNSGHTQLRLK